MRKPTLKYEWMEEMRIGIKDVDDDHMRFFDLINELNLAISKGKHSTEIKECLQLIIDDAERHFIIEEKLIQGWNYPFVEEHSKIHQRVLLELNNIHCEFLPYGNDSQWLDAGVKIKKILVGHILNDDMKYADYFHNADGKI